MVDFNKMTEDEAFFFARMGGKDDWTVAQKTAFWEKYDETDVELAKFHGF